MLNTETPNVPLIGRVPRFNMNYRHRWHRYTLHALFAHPISNNIDPRLVKATLEELDADITHGGHGHLLVTLNGLTHGFHDGGRRHYEKRSGEAVQPRRLLE